MTQPNPDAPPAVTIDARTSVAPLPAGVRRFRLDPARYDRFQRIVMVQLLAIAMALFTLILVPVAWLFRASVSYLLLADALMLGWIVVARSIRIRIARKGNLDSYELLVSERAARRNLGGWTTAEILRPEVASIVEVRTGLWIRCTLPPRSLFVASAIGNYEAAREMFSRWAPIETMTGLSAWRTARREGRRQGPRDETFGTALAVDPSLVMELEMVRSASTTPEGTKSLSRQATLVRVLVVWFALIFFFLAVWQFLSPSSPR